MTARSLNRCIPLITLTVCLLPFQVFAQRETSDPILYHYEPVPGKLVGLAPDLWSLERLTEFKLKYGFSGVVVNANRAQYNNALQAGFTPPNIMVNLVYDNHVQALDSFLAGVYYIDEPVEHNVVGRQPLHAFTCPKNSWHIASTSISTAPKQDLQ